MVTVGVIISGFAVVVVLGGLAQVKFVTALTAVKVAVLPLHKAVVEEFTVMLATGLTTIGTVLVQIQPWVVVPFTV